MVAAAALNAHVRMPRAGGAPTAAVILLHGYGDSGAGLIDLAPPLAAHLPGAVFISPDAPNPCDMAGTGLQWFGLEDWSPQALYNGALRAETVLHEFIDLQLAAYHLPATRLALLGFSQGCMMALHVGLRHQPQLGAVAGFSGGLVGAEMMGGQVQAKPPVLLVHGMMDHVVPYAAMPASAQFLRHAGVEVTTETRAALGHSIDAEGLDRAGRFLAQHLGAAKAG